MPGAACHMCRVTRQLPEFPLWWDIRRARIGEDSNDVAPLLTGPHGEVDVVAMPDEGRGAVIVSAPPVVVPLVTVWPPRDAGVEDDLVNVQCANPRVGRDGGTPSTSGLTTRTRLYGFVKCQPPRRDPSYIMLKDLILFHSALPNPTY